MNKKMIFWSMVIITTMVFSVFNGQTTIWEETFNPPQEGWTLQNNWGFQTGFLRFSYLPVTPNFNLSASSPLINLPIQEADLVVSHYYNDYVHSYGNEFLQIIVISGTQETVIWSYDTNNGDWGSFGGEDLELSLADFIGQQVQLKFRVYGGSTENLNYWRIYNVSVSYTIDNDLETLSITGPTNPAVGVETDYTVSVRNNGLLTQNNYTVQLIEGEDTVLSSINGQAIAHSETIEYLFSHTFTTSGPTYIKGKVILAGDQMPENNITSDLQLTVYPEGTTYVHIGDAATITKTYMMPFTFWLNNSVSQSIYFADEFDNTYGVISGIEYFNSFVADLDHRTVKIWMGQVLQDEIPAGYFPYSDFTLVFNGTVEFPSGNNSVTIPLQNVFNYSYGNLVVMTQRVYDVQSNHVSNQFYYTSTPQHPNRTRSNWGDTAIFNPMNLPTGNPSSRVPNTGFYFSESFQLLNDMAALSISGNLNPTLDTPTDYTVTVSNNGSNMQDNYTVRLMSGSGLVLASLDVTTPLQQFEETDVVLTWSPQITGPVSIYGEVLLADDEVVENNTTPLLNTIVQDAGITAVTVGTDNTVSNDLPLDFFRKNSLSQTIYMADDLDLDSGLLTGISYYNSFSTNLQNRAVKLWIAETNQTSLSDSWLDFIEFTHVFNGSLDFPSGQNEIHIPFDSYYQYNGGNLVIMAYRVYENIYWHSSDRFFYTETPDYPARSRWYRSDDAFNPEDLNYGGTLGARVPNTTLFFYTLGTGTLTGHVYNNDMAPLSDVAISIIDTGFSTIAGNDGSYSFPHLFPGSYTAIASKEGYHDTIIDDIEITVNSVTTQDFTMQPIATISLSGLVVENSSPENGIAQAFISLIGNDQYFTITNEEGLFSLENVYSNHTYLLTINANGYSLYQTEVTVEEVDIDLGTFALSDFPYPPHNLTASLDPEMVTVDLIWHSPLDIAIDYYFSDFEDNNGGWTSGSINGANIWEWGVPNQRYINSAYSRNKAWMTGLSTNYVNNLNIWLKSPEINLTGVSEPYFSVWLNIHAENGFDGMILESSIDNGSTWQRVVGETGFYNNHSAWGEIPPPRWSGLIGLWQPYSTFIPELGNEPSVYFRFRFQTSDNNAFFEGIAIDDVYIGPEPLGSFSYVSSNSDKTRLSKSSLTTDFSRSRALQTYLVYRMLQGQEENENLWQEIGSVEIPDTTFTDTELAANDEGLYRYAVKAVYTDNNISQPTYSNPILHDLFAQVTINVTTNSWDPVTGAQITLTNQNEDPDLIYTQTLTASSFAFFSQVLKGYYNLTVSLPGFEDYYQENLDFTSNSNSHSVQLIEALHPVNNLTYTLNANNITLEWQQPLLSYGLISHPPKQEDSHNPAPFMSKERKELSETDTVNTVNQNNTRALLSYNVFRNGILIADNVTDMTYLDQNLANGVYVYGVQAVYATGLSEIVYTDEIVIGTSDADLLTEPSLINRLNNNYPNPFNPETKISFSIAKNDDVLLEVFNVSGQRVKTLLNERMEAGTHSVIWDGKTDSNRTAISGIYFYRIQTGSFNSTKKMILLK